MGSGDECMSQTSMLLMDGRWEGGDPRPGEKRDSQLAASEGKEEGREATQK